MLLAAFQSQIHILKQAKLYKHSLTGLKQHFSTSHSNPSLIIDRISKVTNQKPEKRWHYLQAIDLDLYNNFSSLTPSQSYQILQSFSDYSSYHLLRSYSIQSLVSIIIQSKQNDIDVKNIALDLALILKRFKYQYVEDYDSLNKILLSKEFKEFSIDSLQKIIEFWEYYSWRHPITPEITSFINKAAESHYSYATQKEYITKADLATEIRIIILQTLERPKTASAIQLTQKYSEILAKYMKTNSNASAALEFVYWTSDLESFDLQNIKEFKSKLSRCGQESFVSFIKRKDVPIIQAEKRSFEKLVDELFSRRMVDIIFAELVVEDDDLDYDSIVMMLSKIKKYELIGVLHSYPGLIERFQALRAKTERGENKSVTKEEKDLLFMLLDDLDIYTV